MKSALFTFLVCLSGVSQAKLVDLAKNYDWTTHKETKKFMSSAVKRAKSRKISSSQELDDSYLSKEFKAFRTKFLSIKEPLALEAEIKNLNKSYDELPTDLKLITALITPMVNMKSFAYRMYPLLTKSTITHSTMVSRVYRFASFLSVNLPTDQWDAGFRYTTEPFDLEVQKQRFETPADLQRFVETDVYPSLKLAASRLQALDLSSNEVTWDHKILYGTASFQDDVKRYRIVGEPERLLLLANLHNSMAWSLRFSAYNLEGSIDLIKDVSKLYGLDRVLGIGRIDGVAAYNLVEKLQKKKYKNLFTLRGKDGAENMQYAYKHMQEATRIGIIAWEEIKNRSEEGRNEFVLIRSEAFAPFTQEMDRGAQALLATVNDKNVLRSDVTGEVVTVDMGAFFNNPPQDLKALMPVFGDSYKVPKTLEKKIEGKTVKYRNYHYGQATNWNASAFKTILPDLKDGRDVSKYTRIINQSVGSAPVGMLLNSVMFYNL